MKGSQKELIPKLLELYAEGRISLKKLIKLAPIPPLEVFSLIATHNIEPNIPPEIDEYTYDIALKIIETIKEKN